ncbi:MAG: hypothetical protein NT004_00690 [Bacteroidetes bacterium]|nr:hypothetical protein [Bacteroidota bacterium]
MKTVSKIILTLAMALLIAGMGMSQVASNTTLPKKATKSTVEAPGKFVDANKNGICDKHESKGTCSQATSCKGKTGEGVCDHNSKNCKDKGTGCGSGTGNGNCCGKGEKSGNGCGTGCGKGMSGCSARTGTPAPQPTK